jgi:hypothetical protein
VSGARVRRVRGRDAGRLQDRSPVYAVRADVLKMESWFQDLIVLLGLAGLALMVTRGAIFLPLHRWAENRGKFELLLSCPLCFGFWSGSLGWLFYSFILAGFASWPELAITSLAAGGSASLLAWWADGGSNG